MAHHDPQLARGRGGQPPVQVRRGGGGQVWPLLAGGPDPGPQPLPLQRPIPAVQPPRAGADPYPRAEPVELRGGGVHRVRAEQLAAGGVAALVGVERGVDLLVQRVGRGQRDPADHRQGQEGRGVGAYAGGGAVACPRTGGVRRAGPLARTQAAASAATSSPVNRSSRAEAVTSVVPARSPAVSRVTSCRRVATVTGVPSAAVAGLPSAAVPAVPPAAATGAPPAAAPAMPAAACRSRSGSRSYKTQCWGPGSRPASHRPIAPVPQPRSRITSPSAGRSGPAASTSRTGSSRSSARAAASAASRRRSQDALTRTGGRAALTPAPGRPGRARPPGPDP